MNAQETTPTTNCQLCSQPMQKGSTGIRCTVCREMQRSAIFLKMFTVLQAVRNTNKGFDAVKDKCKQLYPIVQEYSLSMVSYQTFDIEDFDKDTNALTYLRNHVCSETNIIVQKHLPVDIKPKNKYGLYATIALLCRLDIETGANELRVRNVIDLALNINAYYSHSPDLHKCVEWENSWQLFVMNLLSDQSPIILANTPNACLTVVLHSLANILNIIIRSVYPTVPIVKTYFLKQFNRLFYPLNMAPDEFILPIITIFWSNTTPLSSHSSSNEWIPNCVVPLLPKPESIYHGTMTTANADSAASQKCAERNFYMLLPCTHRVTQSTLNKLVSDVDQLKYAEANIEGTEAKVPTFRCSQCHKTCDRYAFDHDKVKQFREQFNGTRYTYILVDKTSSMTSVLSNNTESRIVQTKEAVKQLLKEIAKNAGPDDEAIMTLFDKELIKPDFIPECTARNIATDLNLKRIDAIELSKRSVKTHFYSIMEDIYKTLEEKPRLYIDVYVFSDGIDTSSRKNDNSYQAMIRYLNQKIGAKCHFMNCGSAAQGYSLATWLGDPEANCPYSGSVDEIQAQIASSYKKNNPVLRSQRYTSNRYHSSHGNMLTDQEIASLRKPIGKGSSTDKNGTSTSSCIAESTENRGFDDNCVDFAQLSTDPNDKSVLPKAYTMVVRATKSRKH